MSQQSIRQAARLRRMGLVSSTTVGKLVPNLLNNQLSYWTLNNWIREAEESRKRRSKIDSDTRYKYYYEADEVYKVQYMDFVVNKLGTPAAIAVRIVNDLLQEGRVEHGLRWVQYKGAVIGLPNLKRVV